MSKASGSTASLMQGVSQQAAQDRGPGQLTEQVNMLPDPVQGLSRRHGSRFVAETDSGLDPSLIDILSADTANWRTFQYSNAGHDYVVLYRAAAKPAGSTLPVVLVYDRTTAQFLVGNRNTSDAQLDLLENGGVSAITAIGKYVFLAGYTTATGSVDTDMVAPHSNDAVVWIRGGAYARTFTVTATKTDNTQVTFSYLSPTSSYTGTLDTSTVPVWALDPAGGTDTATESAYATDDGTGVVTATLLYKDWNVTALTCSKAGVSMTNTHPVAPVAATEFSWATPSGSVQFSSHAVGEMDISIDYTHNKVVTNPNYSYIVGDLTNVFNSAVTNWIGTAATAIQPESIAQQLQIAAVAAGLATATVQGQTVIFDNVTALTVSDSGDGTLIRGVANEVTDISEVSDVHIVGKVVKVRARDSAEAFYLKAIAKDGVSTGYTEVTWLEGAGIQHSISDALLFLTVSAGHSYIASSPALLDAIVTGPCPTYVDSTAGDNDSSPTPFFVGKVITYLGVFQDRLVIGAGAVVRCSKIGDYLNFFRTSILTAPADDPLEMLSQGSDDDTLRFSLIYDRDLVIFGDKRQYAISGRSALSPTSANMAVMSQHADAAQLPPLAVGGVIFYGQQGEVGAALYQVQPGQVTESPESYIQSSQIDTYLSGQMIEMSTNAKPTHLLVRMAGARNSIFVYTYLDKAQQGRVQDAWHRFDYHPALGPIIGMGTTPDGLLVFTLRAQNDHAGDAVLYLCADLQPFTAGLATYPYLDSIRPLTQVNTNTGSVHSTSTGDYRVAFDSTSQWKYVGGDLSDQASLLAEFPDATGPQVGIDMTAYFIPTNPMFRDRNDKVVTVGRLTVGSIRISLAQSSGVICTIVSAGRETTQTFEYNARIVGSPDDIAGRETITNMVQSQPVGLETFDYTLTIGARKWLPFTVTDMEWVGQWFSKVQRI